MEDIQDVIGLPPDTINSNNIRHNTMPIAEITPGQPQLTKGSTLFRISPRFRDYLRILNEHGYNYKNTGKLKVAFLADNFPTDSFSNEYGESFLNKITDVASTGFGQISQMAGGRRADETIRNIGKAMEKSGGMIGAIGKGIGTGGEKLSQTLGKLKKAGEEGGAGGRFLARASEMASSVLAGGRLDFPQLWKDSSFKPSYTMTVRLYNPNPASDKATNKYILGPLAALLILALPQTTTQGTAYNWPFFHKVRCPGIYFLNPCFIGGITVVKGGDQQQIAWNQRLSIVDVRIELGSLYDSIVMPAPGHTFNTEERPTLKNYLAELLGKKPLESPYFPSSTTTTIPEVATTKNQATNNRNTTVADPKVPAESRVASNKKDTADTLSQDQPTIG